MTQDIVTLYVTLLSQFFSLSSAGANIPVASGSASTEANAHPVPSFIPPHSCAPTVCHWLLKILNEISECVSEVGALELAGEASQSLKELVASARWKFEEAICAVWVRGQYQLNPTFTA
jgi:exocyst complex component 2